MTHSALDVLLCVERALGIYYARSTLLTLLSRDPAAAAALSVDELRRAIQPLFVGVSDRPHSPAPAVGGRGGCGTSAGIGTVLPPCREVIANPPMPPLPMKAALVTAVAVGPVGGGGGVRDTLDAALAAWIHASPTPERLISLATDVAGLVAAAPAAAAAAAAARGVPLGARAAAALDAPSRRRAATATIRRARVPLAAVPRRRRLLPRSRRRRGWRGHRPCSTSTSATTTPTSTIATHGHSRGGRLQGNRRATFPHVARHLYLTYALLL